jgi:hypothetical protein
MYEEKSDSEALRYRPMRQLLENYLTLNFLSYIIVIQSYDKQKYES